MKTWSPARWPWALWISPILAASVMSDVYVTRRALDPQDVSMWAPDILRFDRGGRFVASTLEHPVSPTWYEGIVVDERGVLVADWTMGFGRIFRYDTSLEHVETLRDWYAGYSIPSGLTIGPDGAIYAASTEFPVEGPNVRGQVFRFDGDTGAPLGPQPFVALGAGGLSGPFDLEFGSDGDLYVSDASRVARFDGDTGEYLGDFADLGSAPATGLAFGPSGDLFIASGNRVLRYNEHGEYTGLWVDDPSPVDLDFQDVEFGPGGDLLVASPAMHTVLRYSGADGRRLPDFIPTGSTYFGAQSPRFLWATPEMIPETSRGIFLSCVSLTSLLAICAVRRR